MSPKPIGPKLVVGCPVLHRGWILEKWFQHVAKACAAAELEVRNHDEVAFVFVGDENTDPETYAVVMEMVGRGVNVLWWHEPEIRPADIRDWRPDRFHRMVVLRNYLLTQVRELEPGLFFSLDSDILVGPEALISAMALLSRFDAVGMRTFMTQPSANGPSSTAVPNWANLGRGGQLVRHDVPGSSFGVDVIMAAKLMKRAAYAVDYVYDLQGEDIGWSNAAREAGVKLGWDGNSGSKHVLSPDLLDLVDDRVGF